MPRIGTPLTKRILSLMNASAIDRLFQQIDGALGAILTLHHVKPDLTPNFAPNAHLTITPSFLSQTLELLTERGFDFIAMDDVPERIANANPTRRFAAITFDDGYRDNILHATPILHTHNIPYTIYLAPGLIDGTAFLWWEALEEIVSNNLSIEFQTNGAAIHRTETLEEKQASYRTILDHLIEHTPELDVQDQVRVLADTYGVDVSAHLQQEIATWDELEALDKNPLCNLGAHTLNHHALRRLSEVDCASAITAGIERQTEMLGTRPAHFAYPYGQPPQAGPREFTLTKEIGFRTAVTTRPGVIYAEHADHLTALPRLSLNGLYQEKRYLAPLSSGFPTRLLNRMRRLNVS